MVKPREEVETQSKSAHVTKSDICSRLKKRKRRSPSFISAPLHHGRGADAEKFNNFCSVLGKLLL